MGAIGVSATLPDDEYHTFYKAEYPAICLSSSIKLSQPDKPVTIVRVLPSGWQVPVDTLQGLFLGKGTKLFAYGSSGCQIDLTLVSQSVKQEHSIIYPMPNSTKSTLDHFFATSVCNSCLSGSRVIRFGGVPGGQITVELEVQSSVASESVIKAYRWLVEPKCPPLVEGVDVEEIALLPATGGTFFLTILENPMWISFLGQRDDPDKTKDLMCVLFFDEENQTKVTVKAFPGEEASPSGGY